MRLCGGALSVAASREIAISATFVVDDIDLAGDLDRVEMVDGEILENERR